jgi:hypothetical protein
MDSLLTATCCTGTVHGAECRVQRAAAVVGFLGCLRWNGPPSPDVAEPHSRRRRRSGGQGKMLRIQNFEDVKMDLKEKVVVGM